MKDRWAFAWLALLLWVAALPEAVAAAPAGPRGSRIYDVEDGLLAGVPAAVDDLSGAGRDGLVAHDAVPAWATLYSASLLRPLDVPLPLMCLVTSRDGFALYRPQGNGRRIYVTSRPRLQTAPTSLWCVVDLQPQGSAATGDRAIRPSAVPDALWGRMNSRNGFDV